MDADKCSDIDVCEASLGGDHHIVKIDSPSSPQHPLEEIADGVAKLLLFKGML